MLSLAPVLGENSQPKRVLVLGGTSFLGPAVVNSLVGEGHTVTFFNRGVTNPELFPHLEKLRGFRSADSNDQDLTSLAHRRFDAIVDVWPNDPNIVAPAAESLKTEAPHYLFVSSIAAYDSKEFAKADTHEDAPMEPFDGPGRTYLRTGHGAIGILACCQRKGSARRVGPPAIMIDSSASLASSENKNHAETLRAAVMR